MEMFPYKYDFSILRSRVKMLFVPLALGTRGAFATTVPMPDPQNNYHPIPN